LANVADVALVSATAAAEHVDVAKALAPGTILFRQLHRVAGVGVLGLVELGVAAPGGVPSAWAAQVTPTASGTLVMVMAVTMSAPASANTRAWPAW
jgi:hypothetical protein